MHLLTSSAALFTLLACGHHKPSEPESFAGVAAKAAFYCEQSRADYETKKWVVEECDGLGFTSLYSLACPANGVQLSLFEDATGKLYRSPDRGCYPGKSKAELSKDHVLMRLVAAVGQGDKAWPARFQDYVDAHSGVFCDAIDAETKISRCLISPFLYASLSKAAGRASLLAESDDVWFEKSGFEAHLQVLGIWLKGKLDGSIGDMDLDYLATYAQREPLNALYQAAAYRYGRATKEAVDNAFGTSHWPDSRLPDSADHCSSYLFQRDMTSAQDWQPCADSLQVWSGTDYAFAAYVLAAP